MNKEKTPRELANEKYRQNHKEYYNEYYRNYYKTHKKTNYAKVYKHRLELLKDKLYCWGEVLDAEFQQEMLKIIGGEFDDNVD